MVQRRDYLMDQINELGLFIVKLLGRLKKQVENKEEDQMLETAKDAFQSQFDLNLEDLLFMDESSFVNLMEEKLLVDEHYEKMGEVFETLGDHSTEHHTILRRELYYKKALFLNNYIENTSQTYSMERSNTIARINSKLKI